MKINYNKKTLFAILCMLVGIFILFEPIIFGNKTFGSPDSLSPKAVGIALNQTSEDIGEFAQWQPWIFSGMPSAEAFTHISKLYFPEYLFNLFSLSGIFIQLLHLLFAGIGCFFLLKYFKCSEWAALLGSLGFMITPYMITMVVYGHGSQMMTAAYIPWVFWFTVRVWNDPNLLNAGWLGILLGFQLQRAHVQIAYYTWLLIGAYSLLMIITEVKNKENRNKFGKSLSLFSIACLLGIGLSLLIYLPAIGYSEFSIRGGSQIGGDNYNYATGWSFHPKEILTFFIPSAFGFGGQPYWGFMPFTDYPNYMGIIILILAILGFNNKRDLIHWFFVITSLLALFISFGKHFSLIYDLFYNIFPYFNKFRVPHMILILLQFNISILAAFGIDSLLELKSKNIPRWFWIISSFIGLFLIVLTLGSPFIESALRDNFAPLRNQNPSATEFVNNLRWNLWINDAWMMALISATFLGLIWMWFNEKISKRMILILTTILSVADIAIVDYKIINPARNSGRNSQLISNRAVEKFFKKDEIIEFLDSDKSDFRIYPVAQLFGESRFAAFGLESMGGYHPAKLNIYQNFLSKTGNASTIPLLRMMNVKYLISPQKINHPDIELVKRGSLPATQGNIPVEVYNLQGYQPRAWFVKDLQYLEDEKLFNEIIKPDFNPGDKAFVNKIVSQPSQASAAINNLVMGFHKISLKTESLGNQFLVLSEIFYPLRWKAYINNEEVETLKVNGIIRGLPIPAGNNNIEFRYDKSSFNSGLIFSLISLSVLVSMIIVGFTRKKNR